MESFPEVTLVNLPCTEIRNDNVFLLRRLPRRLMYCRFVSLKVWHQGCLESRMPTMGGILEKTALLDEIYSELKDHHHLVALHRLGRGVR